MGSPSVADAVIGVLSHAGTAAFWRLRGTARRLLFADLHAPRTGEVLAFRCNICGTSCRVRLGGMRRETPDCPACRSTPRYRAVVWLLSQHLFGRPLALPEFPVRKDITGLGLSDWYGYARGLARKLSYTNTFFHQRPRLDITDVPSSLDERFDFVISSEVIEHVSPPAARAFSNTRRLLKRGGLLILTVPYVSTPNATTVEHYPELHDYRVTSENGKAVLHNTTVTGQKQTFNNLVFHGGSGASLELRIFSEEGLISDLRSAGFTEVRVVREPHLEHGVHWPDSFSRPVVCRA